MQNKQLSNDRNMMDNDGKKTNKSFSYELRGIALAVLGLICLCGVFGFNIFFVGNFLGAFLGYIFGIGAIVPALLLLYYGYCRIMHGADSSYSRRTIGLLASFVIILALFHHFVIPVGSEVMPSELQRGGGFVGGFILLIFRRLFGVSFGFVLLGLCLLIAISMVTTWSFNISNIFKNDKKAKKIDAVTKRSKNIEIKQEPAIKVNTEAAARTSIKKDIKKVRNKPIQPAKAVQSVKKEEPKSAVSASDVKDSSANNFGWEEPSKSFFDQAEIIDLPPLATEPLPAGSAYKGSLSEGIGRDEDYPEPPGKGYTRDTNASATGFNSAVDSNANSAPNYNAGTGYNADYGYDVGADSNMAPAHSTGYSYNNGSVAGNHNDNSVAANENNENNENIWGIRSNDFRVIKPQQETSTVNDVVGVKASEVKAEAKKTVWASNVVPFRPKNSEPAVVSNNEIADSMSAETWENQADCSWQGNKNNEMAGSMSTETADTITDDTMYEDVISEDLINTADNKAESENANNNIVDNIITADNNSDNEDNVVEDISHNVSEDRPKTYFPLNIQSNVSLDAEERSEEDASIDPYDEDNSDNEDDADGIALGNSGSKKPFWLEDIDDDFDDLDDYLLKPGDIGSTAKPKVNRFEAMYNAAAKSVQQEAVVKGADPVKDDKLEAEEFAPAVAKPVLNEVKVEAAEYIMPEITEILDVSKKTNTEDVQEEIQKKAEILAQTLKDFNVQAEILAASRGPAVTQYEVKLAPGVKVNKITNLSDEIALNMAVSSVRIEIIPGKAAIGIEVPNNIRDSVPLRDVLEQPKFKEAKSPLTMGLGMDISGNPIFADMVALNHMLVAGATGSGKSVCINTIISSILFKAHPDDVKFILVDPKMVELSVYNGIPHLMVPVVVDAKVAASVLNWSVQEMERRYEQLSQAGVRNIAGYNKLYQDEPEKKMHSIVIIIDELADLMMVAPHDVEDAICRIAQKARAAGIYLILATQRPSVNVITGTIKANIPSRISFAVASQIDSRTILDAAGAEKLLGRGDMMFAPVGSNKPTRIQGAFISDAEVERLVDFICSQGYEFKANQDIIDFTEKNAIDAVEPEESDSADSKVKTGKRRTRSELMMKDALELILSTGTASISNIKRRFHTGLSTAQRIVDNLEELGILGPSNGSKCREIIVSSDRAREILAEWESRN